MNNELTSLSDFAFRPDFSAVRFDGFFDQTQTQTVAVNLFVNNRFSAIKRLENMFKSFDEMPIPLSSTVIFIFPSPFFAVIFSHFSPLRVFYRICNQILNGLRQSAFSSAAICGRFSAISFFDLKTLFHQSAADIRQSRLR